MLELFINGLPMMVLVCTFIISFLLFIVWANEWAHTGLNKSKQIYVVGYTVVWLIVITILFGKYLNV